MEQRYDVVALGELLIDFTENGISGQGNGMFEANPGGAPCNVLSMLTNLGRKTAFIGKVGDDFFGQMLKQVIESVGIDASALSFDKTTPTTLAFVHTDETGDRDFSFYRNPGADVMLQREDVPEQMIASGSIFHFGSLSLTHPEVREATKKAVDIAKAHGCLISFDPNLREPLWTTLSEAKEQIAYGISVCDVLKISDNEIRWFTGKEDFDAGIRKLQKTYHPALITLSKGSDGSAAYYGTHKVEADAFVRSDTIETTGAGDTFCACILHGLLGLLPDGAAQAETAAGICGALQNISEARMYHILTFANAAASIITTRKGALRVMPSKKEVEVLAGGEPTCG